MRAKLVFGALAAAFLLSTAPATALQQVILPQPGDGTSSQNPDSATQDQFSTEQSDGKTNSLGSFHFGVTSGSDWPGDPYRFYRPQTSTPDAYGSASMPGSEFSNSGYPFPH